MQRLVFSESGLARSFATFGSGERCMVFQHGLCGDAAQTSDVFPEECGWMGATLECRGHGGSEIGPHAEISIASFAADLIRFIETRIGAPVALGGISMGAAIATQVAVTRPDLVSALVIARPAWLLDAAPANMRPNAEVAALLSQNSPGEARRLFDASAAARELARTSPDNLASLRGFFVREPIADTQELLARIAGDGLGVDQLQIAALKLPSLVIGNDDDAVHPFALAEAWARILPNARLAKIPSKTESRDRYRATFRATLADFLKRLPR